MAKVKKSIKELMSFDASAGKWLLENGYINNAEGSAPSYTKKEDTKLSLALKNILKQYAKGFLEYSEEVRVLEVKHCLEDHENGGAIKYDSNGKLMFDKEGMLLLMSETKKLKESFKVEITTQVSSLPANLTEKQKEDFKTLVLPR